MIKALELRPGIVTVTIATAVYGEAGEHWRRALNGLNHNGYGRTESAPLDLAGVGIRSVADSGESSSGYHGVLRMDTVGLGRRCSGVCVFHSSS